MVTASTSDLRELGDRLLAAIESAGGKAAISREAKVPLSSLDRYIKGSNEPPSLTLARLAKACNVSLDMLIHGHVHGTGIDGYAPRSGRLTLLTDMHLGPPQVAVANPSDLGSDYVLVPRYDVKASAGNGRHALAGELEPRSEIAFRAAWLRSLGVAPENAEFLTAEGDSMLETIHDGDLLLINRLIDRVVSNAIYVVVLAGQVMVKRLQLLFDGSIMLISDNPRYQPERIDKTDVEGLQVEGRVRWYGRAI